MRTEVKRSLLLWPAAVSATIITVAWLANPDGPGIALQSASSEILASWSGDRSDHPSPPSPENHGQANHWQGNSPLAEVAVQSDTVVLDQRIATPPAEVELIERAEHGSRAMKTPSRLTEPFTETRETARIKAPVRNERQEMAGLILPPPQQVDASAREVFEYLFSDRSMAADGFAEDDAVILNPASNHIDGDPFATTPLLPSPTLVKTLPRVKTVPRVESPSSTQSPSPSTLPAIGPAPFVGPTRPEIAANKPARPASVLPQSIANLGRLEPPVQIDGPDSTLNESIAVEEPIQTPRHFVSDNPAGWPVTQRLDEQLQALVTLALRQQHPPTGQLVSSAVSRLPIPSWADEVNLRLTELRSLPRIGDPRAGDLLDELSDLASEGFRRAELVSDRDQQIEWLCTSHAIARRVAVWLPVWKITSEAGPKWMVSDDSDLPAVPIDEVLQRVRLDLSETGDQEGWAQYLLLQELGEVTQTDQFEQRRILAQRFLARLNWHGLDPEHARWLNRDSVVQLARSVRPWARSAVDYASLVSQIERQESEPIAIAAADIASSIQSLRYADNPDAVRVADALDMYYRNANVRMAISASMLQRMLPSIDPQSIPVRTHMFGSKIRGISQIKSDLALKLNPSSDRWSMELNTLGNVHTQSTGFNGPVAVRTAGNSHFFAATPIEVTARGVQVGDSEVDVQGSTRLRGIRTEYDGWPLIGSLVQSIAASRYDSLAPQSNRMANRKIRDQVGNEIDSKLDEKLTTVTTQLGKMVLGPLSSLQLDPKVIDMQTTEQRLLARYRLAGDWQLAAFTPRPRAPQSSLMSLQVHQSALNNTLEQLVPRDEPKSIQDIVSDGLQMFGQTAATLPDDIPDDVTVQFARTRPITVEVEDGEFWVTLRVMRLTRGDRLDLRRFIVRAKYLPGVEGMHATLVREGHLRISGPGMSMRERLPIRAIFNKVLSPNRPLQLTLPQLIDHPATRNLAVSQLELRDGWIAMAISESAAPRMALRRVEDQTK